MTDKPFISNEKYEATGETKVVFSVTLHRIRAKVAIGNIAAGALGGWIEKEGNLQVSGDAWVSGDARVYGNARVSGDARVSGNARVYGNAQYLTISPVGSENGCLTAFVQKDGSVIVNRGCFSGSIDAFLAKVNQTHGDNDHGEIYRLAVEIIKLRLDTTPVKDDCEDAAKLAAAAE